MEIQFGQQLDVFEVDVNVNLGLNEICLCRKKKRVVKTRQKVIESQRGSICLCFEVQVNEISGEKKVQRWRWVAVRAFLRDLKNLSFFQSRLMNYVRKAKQGF